MFGIGGSEILVILVIALLFLGPDKLPDAAKQISKGIRDLKSTSRALQRQIENDETIGGAIRDLKSALNGDEIPARPPVRKVPTIDPPQLADGAEATEASVESLEHTPEKALTLPPSVGEPEGEPPPYDDNHDELGRLIRSPQGTVAKNAPVIAPAVAAAEPASDAAKNGAAKPAADATPSTADSGTIQKHG